MNNSRAPRSTVAGHLASRSSIPLNDETGLVTHTPVPALECSNVSKIFPLRQEIHWVRVMFFGDDVTEGYCALDAVDLVVPQGKIVGILGRNGAGKSTLLRVLGGVYLPTSGTIRVNGQVAGLFELGGFGNPNLTGREFARRYLEIMLLKNNEQNIEALIDEVKEFSELGDAFDHKIRTYSSGMGARLYFATTTALQHEIYLIDEVLSTGDEHFQAKCWKRMRERLLGGASGILVTHDWTAVLKLCEQAHILDRGKIVFTGRADQAVVTYLNLPIPTANAARFSADLPKIFEVDCGSDTELSFPIEILEPCEVDFAMSIETLRNGNGWEVIILTDFMPVASMPGKFRIKVMIKDLPLCEGVYSLNVSLSRRKKAATKQRWGFDSRNWTVGNGLELVVNNKNSHCKDSAILKLPYRARRIGDSQ